MADLFDNPMGTDGFEFIEYTHPQPEVLDALFRSFGFKKTATHKSKKVALYQQGDINYVLNFEPNSGATSFISEHQGPGACAMAFRVKDAAKAFKLALEKGAKPFKN